MSMSNPKAKKETDLKSNDKFPKISSTSSSRQWSTFKNPRIVRVSRAFGGKDRHSKVCTVRGLRDRRIRLSVPTAIQLYDLQDRLGLNQPSKVVDWLIDATKHEIDKLPPLPMLPVGNLHQGNPQSSHFLTPNHPPFGIFQTKNKEREGQTYVEGKEKWIQENHQEGFGGFVAQNLFPLGNINQSSFPNMAYNSSLFHWDPPNLSLSQFGGGYPTFSGQSSHQEDDQTPHNNNNNNNSLSSMASSHQLYLCPSAPTIPSIVPPFIPSYVDNNDLRMPQNQLLPTTLHLISPPVKSLSLHSLYENNNNNSSSNARSDKDERKYS